MSRPEVPSSICFLGDYHEHHWTVSGTNPGRNAVRAQSAMDATTADAKVDATPPPLCGVGCGGPFGDDGDGGYM